MKLANRCADCYSCPRCAKMKLWCTNPFCNFYLPCQVYFECWGLLRMRESNCRAPDSFSLHLRLFLNVVSARVQVLSSVLCKQRPIGCLRAARFSRRCKRVPSEVSNELPWSIGHVSSCTDTNVVKRPEPADRTRRGRRVVGFSRCESETRFRTFAILWTSPCSFKSFVDRFKGPSSGRLECRRSRLWPAAEPLVGSAAEPRRVRTWTRHPSPRFGDQRELRRPCFAPGRVGVAVGSGQHWSPFLGLLPCILRRRQTCKLLLPH